MHSMQRALGKPTRRPLKLASVAAPLHSVCRALPDLRYALTNRASTRSFARRYAEFHLSRSYNVWLLVLGLSTLTWRISLYLHTHTHHVASLLRW